MGTPWRSVPLTGPPPSLGCQRRFVDGAMIRKDRATSGVPIALALLISPMQRGWFELSHEVLDVRVVSAYNGDVVAVCLVSKQFD